MGSLHSMHRMHLLGRHDGDLEWTAPLACRLHQHVLDRMPEPCTLQQINGRLDAASQAMAAPGLLRLMKNPSPFCSVTTNAMPSLHAWAFMVQ